MGVTNNFRKIPKGPFGGIKIFSKKSHKAEKGESLTVSKKVESGNASALESYLLWTNLRNFPQ